MKGNIVLIPFPFTDLKGLFTWLASVKRAFSFMGSSEKQIFPSFHGVPVAPLKVINLTTAIDEKNLRVYEHLLTGV